jgi:hypothetical protein
MKPRVISSMYLCMAHINEIHTSMELFKARSLNVETLDNG